MSYIVNPEVYNSVFVVPCSLVDQHIKMAGSAQLKVLLWLLRNNGKEFSIEDISAAVGLAKGDTIDAFQYWVENGLVLPAETLKGTVPKPQVTVTDKIKNTGVVSLGNTSAANRKSARIQQKPSREEVARRGNESPEIKFLLNEAQVKLGRMLNQNETSTLVWLHDYEGLPVSIILMVIEYALSQDRRSFSYIEKTALNWAEQEINTIEKAEKQILRILSEKKSWRMLESVFGLEHRRPSEKEKNFALKWVDEWGFNKAILRSAYEECVNNTSKLSLPYINKILLKWHEAGIKNIKDLEIYKSNEQNKKSNAQGAASYNLSDIESMIINDSFGTKR